MQVRLFGGFDIRSADGDVRDLPGQKDRGLLAILALQPGVAHTRDKLAGLLWSNRGDAQEFAVRFWACSICQDRSQRGGLLAVSAFSWSPG